jgi:hypothetical protein
MASTLNELLIEIQELVEKLEVIGFGEEGETVSHNGQTRSSVAAAISDQFLSLKTMIQGRQSFATKAVMDADLAHVEDVIAEVWNDPVRENNGLYGKLGSSGSGSWLKSSFDDYSSVLSGVQQLEKEVLAIPSKSRLAVIEAGINNVPDSYFNSQEVLENIVAGITDEAGNAALLVTESGEVIIPNLRDSGSAEDFLFSDNSEIKAGQYNYSFALVDENGNVGAGLLDSFWQSRAGSEQEDYSARNQINILKSSELKQEINTTHAINEYDYNQIVVYGQSLSTGHEGWPALSKTQDYGNLMLGTCVRPTAYDGSVFTPFGGDVLTPLLASVQSNTSILTDAEVAALSAGNGSLGETVNQGMVNFAKKLHGRVGFSSSFKFVTTNNGVSGRTIEQLSKNNTQDSTDRYNRYLQSVQKIKAIADGESKSFAVTGIVWMQGESNYGIEDLAAYKNDLKVLRDDMVSDAKLTTGQKDSPVFITYQTGAGYTQDYDAFGAEGLHVAMAQWEFSRENPDCFLAGPIYPYTDKGGHLDANGYRWYGNYLGKIYHKVCTLGQSWSPLSPTNISLIGRDIYIDFHVPEPPLVFDLPYVGSDLLDYANKGFRVSDAGGSVAIQSVEIIESTVVKIVMGRDIDQDSKIWFASRTGSAGNGCLRDSDSIVALDNYEYIPDSGMYAEANRPELNNKPYPLHNWCIAFCLPVNWSI